MWDLLFQPSLLQRTLKLTILEEQGIDDMEGSVSVNLYPNPTSGLVVVSAEEIEQIDVFDNSGRLVITQQGSNQIDLTSQVAGTFVVRVSTKQGIAIRRVVKR